MNRKTLTLLSAIAVCSAAFAQVPGGPQGNNPPPPGQGPGPDGMMPPPGGMPGGPGGMPGMMPSGPQGGMPGMGMPGAPGGPGMGMMPPGAMEEITVPFLGIEASPTDPALRAQTKLAGDAGLTVNFVASDSPAKTAGVQQYDILTKVNDQIIFNPMQLQSLIRSMKAGDEVKLSVVRQGETKLVTAKLTEHKTQVFTGMMPMGPMGQGPGGMMGGGMGGGMGWGGDARAAVRALGIDNGETTVQVKSNNGEVTVTATNKAGETLFTGPVDTKEQRAKVPDNVRALLNDLAVDDLIHRMKSGFQGQRGMGGGFGGPAPERQGGGRRPGGPGGPQQQDRHDQRNAPPPPQQ